MRSSAFLLQVVGSAAWQVAALDYQCRCTSVDPVSKQVFPINDLRKALSMGGIFAVSTVLPEKIQYLARDLGTISRVENDGVMEPHSRSRDASWCSQC